MDELDKFIEKFSGLTEEYTFYNGEITLRYDVKNHVYLLLLPDGTLEVQDGVTTICHILDKSAALVPWGCKMMGNKLLDKAKAFYRYDGYHFSTEQLEQLVRESKSAHKERLEDAGEVGHKAHAFIEDHIKSLIKHKDDDVCYAVDVPKDDPRVTSCSIAALTFMSRHNVRWIFTERKVYSRAHKFAGTLDGLAMVDSCDDPSCCPEPFKDRKAIIDWKTSNGLWIEYLLQVAGAYKSAYEEESGETIEDIFILRLGKEDGAFESWHINPDIAVKSWDAFLKALELSRSMAVLNKAVDEQKGARKAIIKAEKAAQKAEDLKVRCKSAGTYKGVRYPACNGGNPCQTCLEKYTQLHPIIDPKIIEAGNEIAKGVLNTLKNLLDNQ